MIVRGIEANLLLKYLSIVIDLVARIFDFDFTALGTLGIMEVVAPP